MFAASVKKPKYMAVNIGFPIERKNICNAIIALSNVFVASLIALHNYMQTLRQKLSRKHLVSILGGVHTSIKNTFSGIQRQEFMSLSTNKAFTTNTNARIPYTGAQKLRSKACKLYCYLSMPMSIYFWTPRSLTILKIRLKQRIKIKHNSIQQYPFLFEEENTTWMRKDGTKLVQSPPQPFDTLYGGKVHI